MENYHLLHQIGEGQYGKVFKGRRKNTGQILALKFISKRKKSDEDLDNLRQEIEILRRLKHENIILLLDAFETPHEFCVVTEERENIINKNRQIIQFQSIKQGLNDLEWFAYGELFEILEDDKSLPEHEVRKIAQQLVLALDYLHSNRIIHGDMKPQNILISANGVVKLCDFGFARVLSSNNQELTSVKGTPLYMAPELVKELPYNHTADLWSLGIILYELFVGQPPFYTNILAKLVDMIIKDPVKYPDNLSQDFKDFLMGLLKKNPNERVSCAELLSHPFIQETEPEKADRKQRIEKYQQWADKQEGNGGQDKNNAFPNTQQSEQEQQQQSSEDPTPLTPPINGKMRNGALSPNGQQQNKKSNFKFDRYGDSNKGQEKDSPKQIAYSDEVWIKYEQQIKDDLGIAELRKDLGFLDNLFVILKSNASELEKKDKKQSFMIGLKVLCQIMVKGLFDEESKVDITKNAKLPSLLSSQLQKILQMENNKEQIDTICQLIKTIYLLAKNNFDKIIGIENTYIQDFLQQIPLLIKLGSSVNDTNYQSLLINTVKVIGIFANQASSNPIKNTSFYKKLIDIKFIPDAIALLKIQNVQKLHTIIIQVLSTLVHPTHGDIFTFPWKRGLSKAVCEFNERLSTFQSIKTQIYSSLLEIDWLDILVNLYKIDDDNSQIIKISILRIILQGVRVQKEVIEKVLNHKPILNTILQDIQGEEPYKIGTAMQITILLMKYLSSQKDSQIDLQINVQYILDHLEKNVWNYPIVAIISINLLSEILQNDTTLSVPIIQKFQSVQSYQLLIELLNPTKKVNKVEEVRHIEGSGFSCPAYGFNDGVINFLQKLIFRYQKDHKRLNDLFSLFEQSSIDNSIINILKTLNSKSDISPQGFLSLLNLINDTIIADFLQFSQKIFQEKVLLILCELLKESQLKSLNEWPSTYGGGVECVNLISAQLLRILNLPFTHPSQENDLDRIIKELNSSETILSTLKTIQYLQKDHIGVSIQLLSNLILNTQDEKLLASQFINNNGFQIIKKYSLLKQDNPHTLIADTLNILSQFARISKNYYENISRIDAIQELKKLIIHKEALVRAKVCNFIGSICHHSNYFYETILKNDLIVPLIECCKDSDKSTRKFACFAVGNLAFHNGSLYEKLRPSIPHLVKLLKDQDEETRANAAGAFGNFARYSDSLIQELIKYGALYTLREIAFNDQGPGISPKKIALFSIGNLCVYPECKKFYNEMRILSDISSILEESNQDSQLLKFATRIEQRLKR